MNRSLVEDAFAHHAWATLRLIDACLALRPAQLETPGPGTYGSIFATMGHIVRSDSFYVFVASGERTALIEDGRETLTGLRAAMERNGAEWFRLLGEALDADHVLREVDDSDGFRRDAPLGIRLAQALHHETDHRSQICTALTTLGMVPPAIRVWDFGLHAGRLMETWPTP